MGYVRAATVIALSILVSSALGQTPSLSIANYQLVSDQSVTPTKSNMTYRANLVNSGGPLASVTATLTSLDPFSVRIVPGQDTLQFAPVPANNQTASSNTFTIQVDHTYPFDFSKLQWAFQVAAGGPVANAGPNQTAVIGSTVTLNGSASTNPSGVGTLTYNWAFTSRPAGSSAFLSHSSTVMPTFVVDLPGAYVAALTVSNGVASSSASVTVSTGGTPPVANAGPNQTLALGSTAVLNGSGSTSGSGNPLTYAWTLTMRPSGSAAVLTGPATIAPTFVVDKSGTYTAQLIVNDGVASSAASTVTISTSVVKPVANAGPAQSVNLGAMVQLNGSGSTDANGLPLTYQWSLISLPVGSAAALNNPAAVNPVFTADRPGSYVAQLIVNNGKLSSDPATVAVTTVTGFLIANAGPNQTVAPGSTVQLNGSGTDSQNLPLTFQWALISKPAGSTASLSNAVIPNPAFGADLAGTYVAQLIVNNGLQSSAPSTVVITTACAQPTANAGPNQTVSVGATVTLNGSGSGDACHDPLTYAWTFTTRPAGSAATLSGANTPTPAFVASLAGTYVVQLIVNNGFAASIPATVTITASSAGDMILPANVTIAPGQQVNFPVTLASPAPSGGIFISLSSSDTSKVTVAPENIFIPQGGTAASRPPIVNGINAGSATITAVAGGLTPASQVVVVSAGASMSFSPGSLTINATATQNLTLILSSPAPPSGLTVSLSSSNAGVATTPLTVNFGGNTSSVNVPVTGVVAGSATITATAPGFPSAAAGVTVTPAAAISVPSNTTVGSGQSAAFPVTLTAPAPAGGLSVLLASSDTSKVTVTLSVFIAGGATSPAAPPQVNGVNVGSANISASASGYATGYGQVQVVSGGGTSFFSPVNLSVNAGSTQNLTLNLSGPAPAGLTASLSSSNPAVATVPVAVAFAPGATSVNVPVTGVAAGSANIAASVPNFGNASANATVSSPAGTIILPANVALAPGQQVNYPVTLANPAPANGIFIALDSSDTSKVSVAPSNIFIPQGATAANRAPVVTGVNLGSATITASASGYTGNGQVQVIIGGGSSFYFSPASLTITGTDTQNLMLVLSTPAPSGLTVNLSSSNPGVATVPATVSFAAGATSVDVPVTSVAVGSTTITASATGISSASAGVTVTPASGGGSSFFSPASLAINTGITQNLPLYLSAPTPTPLIASLVSINPGAATVPATVTFLAGATSANVPVTGVAVGSSTITATVPGFGSAAASVTVSASEGPSVTWYGACWQPATLYGVTGNFQAIDFQLTTPVPVMVQGSLFFAANCDPSQGIDNMNDFGSLTGAGHILQGFALHPDVIPTSALYWIGPRTADGKCAPGAPCSGCVNYNHATPFCGSLP